MVWSGRIRGFINCSRLAEAATALLTKARSQGIPVTG